MDNKQKHLEFLQAVINRMATNSFVIKGWAITLVVALFALSTTRASHTYIIVAYLPVLMFWILNGFFLWQERLYIRLYDYVRTLDATEIDFSMDTTSRKAEPGSSWASATFSATLLMFYTCLIGFMVAVTIVVW